MEPGRAKEKIRIERATETQDQYSQPIKTWTKLYQPWAEVRSIRANERFSGEQVFSDNVKLFLVRYECCREVAVKDRVVYRGQNYDITGIAEVGFKDIIEIVGLLVK